MRWTVVCGGPAGQGPNFVSNILAKLLLQKGFFVFNSREYESRIRGGHNFNIITFSDKPILSNSLDIDLLIALDSVAETKHTSEMKKGSLVIDKISNNTHALGAACKILGISFEELTQVLKSEGHAEENIKESKAGFDAENRSIKLPALKKHNYYLQNGNAGTAIGALAAGLEFYYAYPMTPASGLLFELAAREKTGKHRTILMESEIAVVNAALGSALTGAKSMAGSSGGGFDLMTESLSLSGMAEIPMVFHLAQRPGPATGAATYTSQGDLNMARHAGHGEFVRVVAAPANPVQATELATQLFYLSQKYRIPAILLSDKHVLDSFYTLNDKPKLVQSKKSLSWPARFTSYESRDNAIATESASQIKKNVDARSEKRKKLLAEIDKMQSFKVYGKTNSKNLIISWGSTYGAIIDAMQGLDCAFVQPLYLEPFPSKIKSLLLKAKNIILVENNSTSQLASLIAEKTGIMIEEKNKILRYDGRPFHYEELKEEISRRLK